MGRNILLCDNEIMIHQLLEDYLGKLGFKIQSARTYGECEHHLQKFYPDIVLLESDLPHDGTAKIINKIRQLGLRSPVLLMSVNGKVTNDSDALDIGANGLIEKPFYLKAMLQRINEMLPV